MSRVRFDKNATPRGDVGRAMSLLDEAQTIIDTLDRPDIGARLQEVIDAVAELSRSGEAA